MQSNFFKSLIICVFAIFLSLTIHAQLAINEIFVTNCSADLVTPDYNYVNWIEILNIGNSTVSLSGFYLSDDSANLKKWPMVKTSLAVNSFVVFYLDGANNDYHSSLKPDADGGTIFIINSGGSIIDKLAYPKQIFNYSYGRKPDNTKEYCYFGIPTRGKANVGLPIYKQSLSAVLLKEGGYYNTTFSLEIQNPNTGGTIYYTTDGTEPTTSSTLYTNPLSISKTTIFRARVIESGFAFSKIVTQTYFVNQRLPKIHVISLVTPSKNLTDNTIGIYVRGTNGIDDNGSNGPANWNRDWDRCVNMEVYDPNKEQVINQLIGAKVFGGWSRSHEQKSLTVSARDKYGKKRFHYKFFDEREFTDFNSIMLRNGGNDWNNTMFRDAMIQKLSDRNMDIDHQMFKPAVIFMNGEYYGLQPFYERSGEDLIEAKFGLSEDEIDVLDCNGIASNGSADEYTQLTDYVSTHSLSEASNYKYVTDRIDLDEYIDYLILEIYSGNSDWPGNNNKIWRRINPEGKWRWIIYDTDFGFGLYSGVVHNTLQMALTINSDWPNPEWATLLLRKLIENEGFKRKFINRFYAHINTTFNPDLVINTIDSIANIISDEIPYHFTRWNSSASVWESNVEIMRDYARKRPDIVRQHLREQFSMGSDVKVKYHTAPGSRGNISFDNISNTDTVYDGAFPLGAIAEVKFDPAPGYKFKNAVKTTDYSNSLTLVKSGDPWKYWNKSTGANSGWNTKDFDDASWSNGKTQMGYGESDEKILLTYGPDKNNKYVSYYFRKIFEIQDVKLLKDFKYRLLYDDGAVIYINGIEVGRINMPEGTINYNTYALSAPAEENVFIDYSLDSTVLVDGTNIIAVEIHQSNATSSDLSFDCEIQCNLAGNSSKSEILTASFIDTIDSNVEYTAWYEPAEPLNNLVINEISGNNKYFEDEAGEKDDWFELYNNGTDTIDLSRIYITDSVEMPLLSRLSERHPEQTKIAPGEYKVLWADKQLNQGPLHVNFKLDKNGEYLGVFQLSGNDVFKMDDVASIKMTSQFTYARFPDITGEFKLLFRGTPGSENLDLPVIVEIKEIASMNNPGMIYFNPQIKQIVVEFFNENINTAGQIMVADINGRIICTNNINCSEVKINMNSQKPGIYLVKAVTGNTVLTGKILLQ